MKELDRPLRKGEKPPKEKRYTLSIDKFRLALDVYDVAPGNRKEAFEYAATFAGGAADASKEGEKRAQAEVRKQRKLGRI